MKYLTRSLGRPVGLSRLVLVKEDGSEAEVFEPSKHGNIVLRTLEIRRGDDFYECYVVRIPEGIIAINMEPETQHGNQFFCCPRVDSWREFFLTVARSLLDEFEFSEIENVRERRQTIEEIASRLDTPTVREAIRKASFMDTLVWDAEEGTESSTTIYHYIRTTYLGRIT